MNISNNLENLTQIQPSQSAPGIAPVKNTGNAAAESVTAHATADKAELSITASQIALSAASPDVRLDKVTSIQNALQAGTYSVPASEVAKKVIGAMLDGDK